MSSAVEKLLEKLREFPPSHEAAEMRNETSLISVYEVGRKNINIRILSSYVKTRLLWETCAIRFPHT